MQRINSALRGMHDNDGTILVIEDNPADLLSVTAAIQRLGLRSPLQVVSNGFAAIEYMKGEGAFQDRERFHLPWLLVLDLDLPLSSGFEFLDWLRQEPALRHLPVVALSRALAAEDMDRADEAGANYLLLKGAELPEYVSALKSVVDFWLRAPEADQAAPPPDWLLSATGSRPNIGWIP